MKPVVDFLKKSQTQYLATIGTDGKPKVRPFQFKLEENGKLYFSTTSRSMRRSLSTPMSNCVPVGRIGPGSD